MDKIRNKIIAENIRMLIKLKGINQKTLAKEINISPSTLSDYLNLRSNPSHGVIQKMADYFGVVKSDIDTTYKENQINDDILEIYNQLNERRKNKVCSFAEYQLEEQNNYIGTTAAGSPIEGEQVPIVYGDQNDVSLLVSGDSMEELYKNGDVITYRKQPTLENGEIGVFVLNGGVTMKRFKNNGDIRLQSLNSKYQDIIVTDADDFAILGKVLS